MRGALSSPHTARVLNNVLIYNLLRNNKLNLIKHLNSEISFLLALCAWFDKNKTFTCSYCFKIFSFENKTLIFFHKDTSSFQRFFCANNRNQQCESKQKWNLAILVNMIVCMHLAVNASFVFACFVESAWALSSK